MRFQLSELVRRVHNPRRSQIPIRDIRPPATLATTIYRSAYLPIVRRWEQALPRILAEYERTLAAMTLDSPADVEAELGYVETDIQRLLIELTPRLREWAVRVERWQRGRWRGAVLSATGVDLQTLIGPESVRQTLEAAINWNVSLVKDVSAQARQRIASSVFSGLNQRRPARDVAREIREAVAMTRRRSINIASHQLTAISSALDEERQSEAGLDVWAWRHSGKVHAREHHRARDGNLYSDNPARVGTKVGSKTVLAAPKRDDQPGMPPFCGCRRQGIVVFAE